MEKRLCTACLGLKGLDEYYKKSNGKPYGHCKKCYSFIRSVEFLDFEQGISKCFREKTQCFEEKTVCCGGKNTSYCRKTVCCGGKNTSYCAKKKRFVAERVLRKSRKRRKTYVKHVVLGKKSMFLP